MAGRILNRRELRRQSDQAEQAEQASVAPPDAPPGDSAPEAKKAKAPATAKARKPRKPKAPPRMRARWGVFDGSMKQVAVFDYNQRAAADEKLAALLAKGKGLHFLQIVKEPMPEPAAPAVAGAAAE
jgi:hypothetical protein